MAEAYSEIGMKGEVRVRAARSPKGWQGGGEVPGQLPRVSHLPLVPPAEVPGGRCGRGSSSSCPLDRTGGPGGWPMLFKHRKRSLVSFAKAGQIGHHENSNYHVSNVCPVLGTTGPLAPPRLCIPQDGLVRA